MTKLAALVLFGTSVMLALPKPCFADDTGTKPDAAQQSKDKNIPPKRTQSPATRSLHAVPPAAAAPLPAPSSKSDSSSPDDTVGGLPGAKPVAVDKQP